MRMLRIAVDARRGRRDDGGFRRAAEGKKIDLRTAEGVKAVKGEWRYADVKIVEVEGKGPDGKPNKTYNIEPKAFDASFDDSKWEVLDPDHPGQAPLDRPGLLLLVPDEDHHPRGGRGQVGLLPDDRRRLRRGLGRRPAPPLPRQGGGAIVGGFNVPNRVELKDPKPGKVYQIAIFAINGPISAAPGNWLFLRDTFLELVDKPK